MVYALSWFVVFCLWALWSLAAWALHAAGVWVTSNAGVLAKGAGAIETVRLPDGLAAWVPPEILLALTASVSALAPAAEALLGYAPTLAGGLSVAIWVIWGLGSVVLIALGLVATAAVAMLRRHAAMRGAAPTGWLGRQTTDLGTKLHSRRA